MPSSFFAGWTQNKILLVSGNILLGIVLIALTNASVFPLDPVNFIFFSFVAFLFALYRPGWAFLFFVGLIPFEIVSIAPQSLGIDLRPYQWVALLLFVAVILRFFARKLPFDLVQPKWFDYLLLLVPLSALMATINAPSPSAALKQAAIIFSFGLVYAVGRIFWQSWEDVKQSIPFFVSSSLVVLGYALWQNIAFLSGKESFEVMAGRPNAMFSEADWLGLFVVIVLCIALVFVYRMFFVREQPRELKETIRDPRSYLVVLSLLFSFMILIITVARSAWLGGAVAVACFCLLILFSRGWTEVRAMFVRAGAFGLTALGIFLVALGSVLIFSLTTFHLFDRASSTASGLQEITIACDQDGSVPATITKIESMEQLASWRCRHIMLEDIDVEQSNGKFIATVYRDDPNIAIRKEIYGSVWQKIKEHPVLGIGWGSIASFLGTDERGAGLNASNTFLEIWLGSGLVGMLAFTLFWLYLLAISLWRFSQSVATERSFLLFLIASWTGITVFNLFNSGILLGFFFLYLALGAIVLEEYAAYKQTHK